MTLSVLHIVGIVFVLILIAGVGVYSGRKVSDASDFTSGGGKAGSLLVAGTIMGTLVSGQATVGTAQLAFSYGMSAWWFTLGSGIGCLVLALGYAIKMRESSQSTLVGVIQNKYGEKSGYVASVLSSIGIFVSVIAQILASTALITTIFQVNMLTAALVSIVIMAVYVIFGGVWGAGLGGVVKLLLLYAASIVGGGIVLSLSGGVSGIQDLLNSVLVGTEVGAIYGLSTAKDVSATFGSLVARGALKDLGSGLSLILGVLSTQTYASAIWSAKNDKSAKKGALLSACLIPPIGIACILIGLFMRGHCITTAEIEVLKAAGTAIPEGMIEIASTSQVFPVFVLNYMPKLFGGIVLGTLFITIVGGGAGLSLGVATIVVNDIIGKLTHKLDEPKSKLIVTRVVIVVVLFISAVVATMVPSAVINDFGYLSMGLRGAVVFVPLTVALFVKRTIDSKWILLSIIAGPLAVLVGNFVGVPFDPLFVGIAVNIVLVSIGILNSRNTMEE